MLEAPTPARDYPSRIGTSNRDSPHAAARSTLRDRFTASHRRARFRLWIGLAHRGARLRLAVNQRGKAATNIWSIKANAFVFMILPTMILQNPE